MIFCSIFVLASTFSAAIAAKTCEVGQTVQTSSGRVNGHRAVNAPLVSEYLGIPYAKPPVGALRWTAPQRFMGSSVINGTKFGPSCPTNFDGVGFMSKLKLAAGRMNLTTSSIPVLDTTLSQKDDIFNEDCLTLNIWTKPQLGNQKKAVMLWIYGGGFKAGGTSIPPYNGQHLANDQGVVVVSINYRLNIFGFPGAPNTKNNLGLLDQRLAVEWVRDNIQAFGGDPARITLFGESAGASSVDFYSYAWTQDPIVAGFIAQSGTASDTKSANTSAKAWYTTAKALNCGGENSVSEELLSCMRSKDTNSILKAIPANIGPSLNSVPNTFGPTVDDTIVFADYEARAASGQFIQKPFLIGHNDKEIGLFRFVGLLLGQKSSDSYWSLQNLFGFACPAAERAKYAAKKVPTWRYRYFGDFPNLALATTPPTGAWHSSEVPIVFGTDMEVQNVTQRTDAQSNIVPYIMGAWGAFAKDPQSGLTNYGWPKYQPGQKSLVRLAYNNQTGPNLADPIDYDYACPIVSLLGNALLYSSTPDDAIVALAGLDKETVLQWSSLYK